MSSSFATAVNAAASTSIREEEALIRVYQAELELLRQQQEEFDYPEKTDNDDIFQDEGHPLRMQRGSLRVVEHLMTAESNAHHDGRAVLQLTKSLRGFVLTAVEKQGATSAAANSTAVTAPGHHWHYYEIQGYFVANPDVSAQIQMTLSSKELNPLEDIRGAVAAHLVALDCHLLPSSNNIQGEVDLTNLEQLCNSFANRLDLPDWIETLTQYLDYEKRQNECLSTWKQEFHCHVIRGKRGSGVTVHPVQDKENRPFVWEWDWRTRQEALRRSNNRSNTEDQQEDRDLQDLIKCTNSCEMALELALRAMQGG